MELCLSFLVIREEEEEEKNFSDSQTTKWFHLVSNSIISLHHYSDVRWAKWGLSLCAASPS